MMRLGISMVLAATFLSLVVLSPISVQAVPVLQVYSETSTAGDMGADHDTWFAGQSGTLYAAGAYSRGVTNITDAYLIFSVPQGSSGEITIGGDSLTITYDLRTDAFTAFSLDPPPSLPPDFNNHYPFQDGVSDFLMYDIGDFSPLGPYSPGFPDWNADGSGSITYNPNTLGEIKDFAISVAGFDWVHADLIAFVESSPGEWMINPGSHDTTLVPEPASLALLGFGLMGLVAIGRRRIRKM
jgi:hypothetical protein